MFRQGRSHIAPQTVFQLTWCFRKTFLLTHKLGTAYAVEMTAESEQWSELPIGATTATRIRSGTYVIRRSSIPPRACMGRADNQLIAHRLVAHRYTYAPPGCRTLQYRRNFIPLSVSLWNDLANPVFDMVWDWRVSRAGPMLLYWPKLLYPYYGLLLSFPFSFFCL